MKKVITVTEAARNFADCVNRARYQNVTFVLLKSGTPVARLVPDSEKVCTGEELASAIRGVKLPAEEASRMVSRITGTSISSKSGKR